MASDACVKQIVCLANSRKYRGRCIAGKEVAADDKSGAWVRPVSARPTGELNSFERQYRDRGEPRVLDVIDVPVLAPQPEGYQRENWLLNESRFWTKVSRVTREGLDTLVDPVAPLWNNGFSSGTGRNDRIPLRLAEGLESSLRFIHVDWLELAVTKGKLAGRFRFGQVEYWLSVTDPDFEHMYQSKPTGTYPLGACFLTVSLGEAYQVYAYKLIAAIIAPEEQTTIPDLVERVEQPLLPGGLGAETSEL